MSRLRKRAPQPRLRAKKWAPRAHALPVVGRVASLSDQGLHADLSLGRDVRTRPRPSRPRRATIAEEIGLSNASGAERLAPSPGEGQGRRGPYVERLAPRIRSELATGLVLCAERLNRRLGPGANPRGPRAGGFGP